MAERYDFYVHDNRKITFNLTEPIMREDSGVTDFVFYIPKVLNGLEVSDWQWWLVFVNAKKEKYSVALTLSEDPERPLEFNFATYTVDYAMSIKAGSVQFALEAINAGTGGVIDNEWHTLTYETKVKETLQGNQAEYAETESDIISELLQNVRTKVNQLVGGATPTPAQYKAQMTEPQKVYLYIGSEPNEHAGHWYYHNGTTFVSGGVYGAGVTDAVPTQGSTNAVQSGGVYSALHDTDTTLSQSGQAADAGVVGDAINEINDAFEFVFQKIESANVFNGALTTGFINLSGVVNGSTDYAYTDKISVTATTFVITADSLANNRRVNVPCRFITAYDENGEVLPAYGQQSVGSDNSYVDTSGANIITLDSSVKYIAISIYKPTAKFKNICISFDVAQTDYVPYEERIELNSEALPDIKHATLYKYLHGKTVAVFGDSIMYGAGSNAKGAVDLLAEKYGMTVEKYCVSGATMGVRTDNPSYTIDEAHHIAKQVRNAISDAITPDIIVFNGGTNDIGGNITIGEMTQVYTEPATESYFADGFETVAYLLKKNFVGIPIIYMRAHNMSSRSYTGQIQYGEYGNKIAEKWGIITADMYKRMNTQLEEYRLLYLADYTHPNESGYNKFYIPVLEDVIFNEVTP